MYHSDGARGIGEISVPSLDFAETLKLLYKKRVLIYEDRSIERETEGGREVGLGTCTWPHS